MKGVAKQLSVLFGLVVGYLLALCFGKVDFSGFAHLQVVSLPTFMPFKPEFDWGAIISIGLPAGTVLRQGGFQRIRTPASGEPAHVHAF